MGSFNFFLTTDILLGMNKFRSLHKVIKKHGSIIPGVIFDSNLLDNEYFIKNINLIKNKYSNSVFVVNDLKSEPSYGFLEQKTAEFIKGKPDIIVAIGGGSTMDLGKGIALLLTNSVPALSLKGYPEAVNDPLPLITIPSIFGSGSEVSYNAVFIDEIEGRKLGINTRKNFPANTIIDPLLTMSAPKTAVISSALDTLVHCVDSFGSVNSSPLSKIYSTEGFNRTFHTLENKDLDNPEARIDLAIGSICGIIALMNSGDGPTNGFAYYFGVKNKIPHGMAGGMFLKDVMHWNYGNGYNGYCNLLNDCDIEKKLFDRFKIMYKKYEIPRLVDFGYKKEHIEKLAIEVSNSLKGSFKGNPIKFDTNSAKEILKKQIL